MNIGQQWLNDYVTQKYCDFQDNGITDDFIWELDFSSPFKLIRPQIFADHVQKEISILSS